MLLITVGLTEIVESRKKQFHFHCFTHLPRNLKSPKFFLKNFVLLTNNFHLTMWLVTQQIKSEKYILFLAVFIKFKQVYEMLPKHVLKQINRVFFVCLFVFVGDIVLFFVFLKLSD